MHRFTAPIVLALAVLSSHSAASAEPRSGAKSGFRSPYFAATVPGSWSRYAMTSDGKTESNYTYRRLPDTDGRAQVEVRTEFTDGQFKGTWSTNRYILAKGYRFEDDALSYMKNCERLFMQTDKMTEEMETPETTLPYIVKAGIDYAGSVRYVGTETIEGRTCDHYTYHYVSEEENATTYDGEVWMNPDVPFGLVRESAKLAMKTGPGSSYSMTLVASGKDSKPGPSDKPKE
jgi:hypothetical protein